MGDSHPHPIEDMIKGIGVYSGSTFPTHYFFAHNANLNMLISIAYDVDGRYIQGGSDWLESQSYDIDAKVDGDKELSYEEIKPLLQHLLEQRFHLATHRVTRPTSGYALLVAKSGPRLVPSKEGGTPRGQILPDRLQLWNATLKGFAGILSRPAGYPVIDKTGILGSYDFDLSYAPNNDPNSDLPSLFTALQEQLGLKLQSQKVRVEFLVIDHVDRNPTEN